MRLKIFFLFLFLLPFILISFFNQPAIDDFWSANNIREYGRIGQVKYCFEKINARYFSNLLMGTLNTLPQGKLWIFKVWPIITLLFLLASFFFFYKSLFPKYNKQLILLLSLSFLSVHLLNMRRIFEGLYWMSATISYQLSIIIFAIGAGSLIRYYRDGKSFFLICTIICAFLLPGCTESLAPTYFLFLALGFVFVYMKKYPVKPVLVCMGVTLLAISIILFGSGNHARVLHDATRYSPGIFGATLTTFKSVGFYSMVWLTNPTDIFALLLFAPLAMDIVRKTNSNTLHFFKKLKILNVLFIMLIASVSIYFPVHYFESELPFPRITTLFFFVGFHCIIALLFLFFIKSLDSKRIGLFLNFFKKYKQVVWFLFFFFLFTSHNFIIVSQDIISGNAYYYNIEANKRFQVLQNRPSDTCYVEKHKHWSVVLGNFENEDSNTNPFSHMDEYFGKTILYKEEDKSAHRSWKR